MMASNSFVANSEAPKSESHILDLYKKYKIPLFISTGALFIIVLGYLLYSNLTQSVTDSAWYKLSEFISQTHDKSDISDSKMNQLLTDVADTAVEPWALVYLSRVYYIQGNSTQALHTINILESSYQNSLMLKNPNIVKNIKNFILSDRNWNDINYQSKTL